MNLGEDTFGTFVYHCHIMQHSDQGMMSLVRVLPQATASPTFAPTVVAPAVPSALMTSPPTASPSLISTAAPSASLVTGGRSFYVSTQRSEASPNNNGTISAPWKSIKQVFFVLLDIHTSSYYYCR